LLSHHREGETRSIILSSMVPEFRIYVDDCGHHDLKSSDIQEQRYLGLTGVIMKISYERTALTPALDKIKTDIFGRSDFVLHRADIVGKVGIFEALKHEEKRRQFDDALIALFEQANYRAFTVVIDKLEHRQKYVVWRYHPYHYCLEILLERYAQWMNKHGKTGDVLFESRGKKENRQLEAAYHRIYKSGTDHVPATLFQRVLTSRKIKLQAKRENVAGLQLADLIANPCYRDLICEKTGVAMEAPFGRKVVDIIRRAKYLRRDDGLIPGWGTKWLP